MRVRGGWGGEARVSRAKRGDPSTRRVQPRGLASVADGGQASGGGGWRGGR